MAVIGAVMLAQSRQRLRMVAWLGVSAILAMLYHHGYDSTLSQDRALGGVPHGFSVWYALSFLGASAARFRSAVPSIVLGAGICGLLLHAMWRRYDRQNPAVFYSLLVLAGTAFAVSYMRSAEGLEQSLASRYRIYSNLALIFAYMYAVDQLTARNRSRGFKRVLFACALGGSVLFCVLSDVAGYRFLRDRKLALAVEMAAWESGSPELERRLAAQLANPAVARNVQQGIFRPIVPTLEQSIALGVYAPPRLAMGSVQESGTGPTITPEKRHPRPE